MSDDDLRRLLDLEAIKQLKARYCRFVDTKQWERLATLFTPDAGSKGSARRRPAPIWAMMDLLQFPHGPRAH